MTFVCEDCGAQFNGPAKHEDRVCPNCNSDGQQHSPLLFSATSSDQVTEE